MDSTDKFQKSWQLLDRETLHDGWFRIHRLRFEHSLFAGGKTGEVEREVFERGHVAAVLPYDPVSDRVALIEQFRIGALHDEQDPWLVEVIAGMIEPGEEPEDMVRREAREEAGLELQSLIPIRRYYASPGGSTEVVHLYCALTDLSEVGGLYGLDEEDEDIRVLNLSADDAIVLLDDGTVRNAISVIALQWFCLNREALKASVAAEK
ncbi:MAG: NUDIX domain-containing protein [Granulosicoccus sp.]|nr:NUDIX domain-containing protein [Granulosicoccus sp.]